MPRRRDADLKIVRQVRQKTHCREFSCANREPSQRQHEMNHARAGRSCSAHTLSLRISTSVPNINLSFEFRINHTVALTPESLCSLRTMAVRAVKHRFPESTLELQLYFD